MIHKFHIIALLFLAFVSQACVKVVYEGSVSINAPVGIVFNFLEDYESYPKYFPDFHYSTTIISDIKTGKDAVIDNIQKWQGHTIKSTYLVTGYEKNNFIEMENKTQGGKTVMIVRDCGDGTTRYILRNEISIPKSMKDDLFAAFDNELRIVKKACEEASL